MPLHFELVVGLFFLEIPSYKARPSKTRELFEWLKEHQSVARGQQLTFATLKSLAKKKKRAASIARTLKRTEGATRQKAFSLGLSLDSRA